MPYYRPAFAGLTASLIACTLAAAAPAPAGGSLSVLFLGDRGHHRPADRAAQLVPVMHDRGIEVTYTEDVSRLNPETLARYDALIVYANIDAIGPAEEKALLDYVAGGGGFVPLHCASFCFRNSDAYVRLVGAQFKSHGTGEFDTETVDPGHPVMQGLRPFRTWDETYVHAPHNEADRVVLQVRRGGDRAEPWTWVRTHGKGRVFYTAYGHDGRTWGNPGFHDLVERGIRWAAERWDGFDPRRGPNRGAEPLTYDPAGAAIPFYPPSQRWGAQGEAFKQMQRPLSPAGSAGHMVVPRGFEAKLFASEPQIAKPLCLAWDHRGRLWLGESVDYPNDLQPRGKGHDRITVCDDTDGDGKADAFAVFAEGLSIPTSLAFYDGGVIVHQAPETIFLKDTDGDGKADVRRTILTGWGTRDTHAGPSNLRWGFDNWLWGAVGYSGFDGTVGGERLKFGQGFYRFRPDGSKLEFLRSTNNNTWGLGLTEEGLVFGSTANGCPSVYMPIPNRSYESVRGGAPGALASIASSNKFYPVTDRVRQVDWHGGFTAAAGHAVYTARTYPRHYWNRTAFVAEPTGHLVATFLLEPDGSDFASDNSWNLLASDDEWTSPIAAEVGPDGNVWAIDWYSYIVQHNPTPQGFKTGKGNAYETPLRDKTHGRVYRVVAPGPKPPGRFALDPADAKGLVVALTNDNLFWRLHAQRLLVERGKRDVVPDLMRLAYDRSVDALGLNPGATHAIWTLHGLNAPEARAVAVAALSHPSAGVRRNAAQALPRDREAVKDLLASKLLNDPDAQVRLAALLALSEMPPSIVAASEVGSVVTGGSLGTDRWLSDGATSAAAANARAFLEAVSGMGLVRSPAPRARALDVVAKVAEHYARGGPSDSVGAVFVAMERGISAKLGGTDHAIPEAIVAGLVRGWPGGRPARLGPDGEKALTNTVLPRLPVAARAPLVALAGGWGVPGVDTYLRGLAESLLAAAKDESRHDEERSGNAARLVALRPIDPRTALDVLELITPRASRGLASGLVSAVARSRAPKAGARLIERLPTLTPSVRADALRALVDREDWTSAFLDATEAGKARLDDLSLDQKQALASHPNKTIAARVKSLLARGGGLPDPDRQKVIDALAPLVLRPADAVKGQEVFRQQCAKCHTHGSEGGKVGPDLTGMAAHPKAELLLHVLDPSRSVEGNYVAYDVATRDGRTVHGLLASETKTAVTLVDTEGKPQPLLREDIEELVASRKSLMPDGFEKQVTPAQLADLLEFLTRRGRFLPLDLRKAATITSVEGMFYSKDADPERLVFPDWSPKEFRGVPFRLVDPEGGRVPNVVLLYGPHGQFPPRMPKSVSLPCHAPARAVHLLGGVSGWGYGGGGVTPTVSMVVRLHYAGGAVEDHPLRNGVELADYIRRVDVPGSAFAFALRSQQVRYLAVYPKRSEPVETVEFLKGPDDTAPVVMAVTVESPE
jgi:putative membrane-bound dehydrogenase-like protein